MRQPAGQLPDQNSTWHDKSSDGHVTCVEGLENQLHYCAHKLNVHNFHWIR
jgi:hypothetical protein